MKYRLPALILVLSWCMAATMSAGERFASPDDIVLQFDPAEIHRQMWEDLKPRLVRRAQLEALAAEKTASNWQEYDMGYYAIELDIDHAAEMIYGRVAAYGRVAVSSLDSVMVNLLNTLTVDSVYNGSGNLGFAHANDHLTVYLDRAYGQDELFYFTVVYHGTPSGSTSFLGFTFSERAGLPLITTLSEPMGARSWWPCNDIPRDKVDSVDIVVTVDTSLVVSSNGLVVSDDINGDGTHTVHWKTRYPIAPYLVSLGIHPYAVWYDHYVYTPTDSMPLHFYVYPDHDAYSRQFFDSIIVHMIETLEGPFGQYPFIEEKYGCTHFNWGGAMEHQTNTSTTSSAFGYSQPVVCHELSHQWWGNMVTCSDWHNIWMNEGFAVYSEALYFEADSGIDYYHAYMNSFEYTGGGSIYINDTTDVWNIFGAIVYDKGGWVLHMLRHIVGDSLFFESLADYRQEYLWSSASTEDFQSVVEATAGMDLDYFFQQWIYGTNRPSYRYSVKSEAAPGDGWNSYLFVRQIQTTGPEVFTMPVDIRITTAAGDETHVIFNDRREQGFVLHTDDEPLNVAFDPDRWISRIAEVEEYTFHIVTMTLADGVQVEPYEDSVVAKGPDGGYSCSLVSGALPSGLVLDPGTCIISGSPYEVGEFVFAVEAAHDLYSAYTDTAEFTLAVMPTVNPLPGDANLDGAVNVGDAVYIVNYVFRNGLAPLIMNWADANADCQVNVGDAVFLINFIFKSGPVPTMGCVG